MLSRKVTMLNSIKHDMNNVNLNCTYSKLLLSFLSRGLVPFTKDLGIGDGS